VDATCDEAMLWKRFDRRVFADSSACAAGFGYYMCPPSDYSYSRAAVAAVTVAKQG